MVGSYKIGRSKTSKCISDSIKCLTFDHIINTAEVKQQLSSLAKGFAHGPLSLHPWHIELDFVIFADRHLAIFTSLAYKDGHHL